VHGGGSAPATDPTRHAKATPHGPVASIHAHGGPIGPIDTGASHATDPSAGAVGTADGALQQAWSDGGAEPFQDPGRPQRVLVLAVLAVVVVGVGAAFAARRHLIHATT
jgi:hypothetical protein